MELLNNILFYMLLVVFIGYISWILHLFGSVHSISESWYLLPKGKKIYFTLFLWFMALGMMIAAAKPLFFFAGAGLAFTGTAARYKNKFDTAIHVGGVFVCIIASQLSFWFDFKLYGLVIISAITLGFMTIVRKRIKNHTFWIEIVAFVLGFIGLAAGVL